MKITATVNGVETEAEIGYGEAMRVYWHMQRQLDVEDVQNYACDRENGAARQKILDNAESIAAIYRKAMDSDESWYYVLEGVTSAFLADHP